jgi:hypothetical protein
MVLIVVHVIMMMRMILWPVESVTMRRKMLAGRMLFMVNARVVMKRRMRGLFSVRSVT